MPGWGPGLAEACRKRWFLSPWMDLGHPPRVGSLCQSLPCHHHLSSLGLFIAFYLLPSSSITFAKIIKLFLEPLGIFVLFSGMWSRPYSPGAGQQGQGQQPPGARPCLSVPVPPLSTATATDRHFVFGVNGLRHLWTTRWLWGHSRKKGL